jgi:hypothetical protein
MKKRFGLRNYRFILVTGLLIVFLSLENLLPCLAKGDILDITGETQKFDSNPERAIFIWWMPHEYWKAVFNDPENKKSDAELILTALRPYTIVAVSYRKKGGKEPAYKSDEKLREIVQVVDAQRNVYAPLRAKDLNSIALEFIKKMRPDIEQAASSKRFKEVSVFIFPSKDKNDQYFDEATKDGLFTVKVENFPFTWRLPLASVIPSQKCLICGDEFNGGYKFCPWDGTNLSMGKNK